MKKNFLLFIFINILNQTTTYSQSSFAFGVKGGLSIGQQSWNSNATYNNSLLFKYHGAAFIETLGRDTTSVLYAQLGYHVRGSAFRFQNSSGYDVSGNPINIAAYTQEFQFNNVSLQIGAKRRGVLGSEHAYYSIGLRAEYTVSTNLQLPPLYVAYAYSSPVANFVNKFNYGVSVAGGYEFPFSELVGGFVELSVHPDISKQYFRPPFTAYDPFQRVNVDVPQQDIRNISIELSIGFRFLRKVVEATNE